MPIIEFANYEPDKVDLSSGVNTALNVFPSAVGFKRVPAYASFSNAVNARPLGGITVKDSDRNVFNYVGTADKLFQLSTGSDWIDSSGTTFSTGDGERWEFVQWKNKVLATNWNNSPRQITVGGSLFSTLTTALRARHIAIVRNFVVFGNTFDTTDGNVPWRLRWSGIDDETDYTVSPVTLADFQDLKGNGGQISRIIGGEFGVIFQERAIWRMSFVGSPAVFQFDNVLPARGTRAPASVVSAGNNIFFLSQDGFEVLVNGTQTRAIGAGRVDDTFFADLDTNNLDRVVGSADIKNNRVLWAYPGIGNEEGRPNRVIVYDWAFDKWSIIEDDFHLLTQAATTGVSLDDLDSLEVSHGAEQVINTTFDTDTDWTKGTGWTIAAGLASKSAGTASSLEQTGIDVQDGNFYYVVIDVINRTAGQLDVNIGGNTGLSITSNAIHLFTVEAGATGDIELAADATFDGSVDSISVIQTSIDLMTVSLDSDQFVGGAFQLGAYDESFRLGFFNGAAMVATITTLESQLINGRRARIFGMRPLINATGGQDIATSIEIGGRNTLAEEINFGPNTATLESGRYSRRSNARYHRFRLTMTGEWEDAVGIEVEAVTAGGRR